MEIAWIYGMLTLLLLMVDLGLPVEANVRLWALNGPANLARSCPPSAADRKSFEPFEHFR
jgi:hypothetical protein